MHRAEIRTKALAHAIDYHSRTYGPVNFGSGLPNIPERPSADEIIATAEKFAGFLLVAKGAQQPTARKR